jgi:AraC family transcriptional regulator
LGLGGRFRLNASETTVTGDAVGVSADVGHTFEAEGLVGLLFIEPESRMGRAIAHKYFGHALLAVVPPALSGDFRDRMTASFRAPKRNDAELVDIGHALVAHLAGDVRAEIPDWRIRKVIAWAAGQLDGQISLVDAIPLVDLSAGRLRHLFVEQTGLPFKTYLLWLRLIRAVECFAAGKSLTQAAHDAGFSDSAHLSRTFRRMFGVTPAALRLT